MEEIRNYIKVNLIIYYMIH